MKKRLLYLALFLPLLLGVLALFVPSVGSTPAVRGESAPTLDQEGIEPEQLVFLLQYLGTDYSGAVEAGAVKDSTEYQEMMEFSRTLIDEYQRSTAGRPDPEGLERLRAIRSMLEAKADPSAVRAATLELVPILSTRLGVVSYPSLAPNFVNGKRVYETNCARCHGARGGGDGPSAAGLDPSPSSFREDRMNDLAPHQIYNAVSFGVQGTEMPSHQESLSEAQRWDVAFYVLTLRHDFRPGDPVKKVGLSLRDLASHSAADLVKRSAADGEAVDLALVDGLRKNPPGPSATELLDLARHKLDKSWNACQAGESETAVRLSVQAYLNGVEPIEPDLRQRDPATLGELERSFAEYRQAVRSGDPETALLKRSAIDRCLDQAAAALTESELAWGLVLLQSLAIILREGIEAALLLGIMITYLTASGHAALRKHVGLGAAGGVAAGLVTWALAQFFLTISPVGQEALEGVTSLLAAGVLFTVCFWIIHNADIQTWKRFIKEKADQAMGGGSAYALAAVAFLAVYREAFETVLFYEALWARSAAQGTAVLGGLAAGSLGLALVMLGMFRFGLKIPLKQFFAVTGLLLGILCFSFAGYGVKELQNIGWIKQTPLTWVSAVPFLDVQSTLEGLSLQVGIVVSFVLGWFWMRRQRRPRPAAPAAPVPN